MWKDCLPLCDYHLEPLEEWLLEDWWQYWLYWHSWYNENDNKRGTKTRIPMTKTDEWYSTQKKNHHLPRYYQAMIMDNGPHIVLPLISIRIHETGKWKYT
jgi:hypothetical protein